jgi:Ca2+-dependent lipid-binding protein
MVVKFFPDPAIGAIKESRKAGMVKIHINIKKMKFNEFDDNKSVTSSNMNLELISPNKVLKKNLTNSTKNYYVVVNVHQSRYLISGDSDGTSDPYVVVKIGNQAWKTNTINDTINPVNNFLN